jgi:hypothetical protein
MDLVPVFATNVRNYKITLYNYDETLLISESLPYNSILYDSLIAKDNINESDLEYIYRNDNDIEDKENYRWTFQGWISEKDHMNKTVNPVYYDLKEIKADTDFVAYAHYTQENFHFVATKEKYFNFDRVTISDALLGSESISGYSISIKDAYRNILRGKITLPDEYNDTPIIEIGDFRYTYNITHIYFKNKE